MLLKILRFISSDTAYQEARYELEDCEAEVGRLYESVGAGRKKSNCSKECFEYVSIIRSKAVGFEFSARSTTLQSRFSFENLKIFNVTIIFLVEAIAKTRPLSRFPRKIW